MVKPLSTSFRMITAKFSSVPKFRNFTVFKKSKLSVSGERMDTKYW